MAARAALSFASISSTPRLVPSVSSPAGGSYRVVDVTAVAGRTYSYEYLCFRMTDFRP